VSNPRFSGACHDSRQGQDCRGFPPPRRRDCAALCGATCPRQKYKFGMSMTSPKTTAVAGIVMSSGLNSVFASTWTTKAGVLRLMMALLRHIASWCWRTPTLPFKGCSMTHHPKRDRCWTRDDPSSFACLVGDFNLRAFS